MERSTTFLINKITDIDEETVEELSNGIERRSRSEIEKLADYMKEEVDKITGNL